MKLLKRAWRPADHHHDAGAWLLPAGADGVEIGARVGDEYASTLVVTDYPAEVGAGWLEPLMSYPGRVDAALHVALRHHHITAAVRDRRGPGHTLHRASEAVRALAACEITATVLDPADAAATVASCLDPTGGSAPTGTYGAGGEQW